MSEENRLRSAIEAANREGRPAFIAYLTAGYPTRAETVPLLLALQAGGADIVELGVPFSDPLADGATIQRANEAALAQGVTIEDCFRFAEDARAAGFRLPLIFMGYYNPVLAYGERRTAARALDTGVDGFIVVDLPPEEAGDFLDACRAYGRRFIPLAAPTTPDARIPLLASVTDAFLYCVSVTGVTGARDTLPPELPEFVARVRRHTSLPLAVGFGISRREHVVRVGELADAVVVGSAILAAIDAADAEHRAARLQEYVEDVTGRRRADGDGPSRLGGTP